MIGTEVKIHHRWAEYRGVKFTTPYSNGFCVTIGKWPDTANVKMPVHCHAGVEIITCVNGRFLITFDVVGFYSERTLVSAGTVYVPANVPHSAENLDPGGELVAVTIPPDSLYKSLADKAGIATQYPDLMQQICVKT